MFHRLILAAIAAVCVMVGVEGDNGLDARASTALVASVRADIGTNPTGWKNRWCAVYLRAELKALGFHRAAKKVDARAISFLKLPRTRAMVGAIAVMKHHVGVVSGFPKKGWVAIIGGNQGKKYRNGRKVSENVYPISRVIAFVTPS